MVLNDHLNDNNTVRLNDKNTRFTPNQTPSSIDHFYTNSPNNVCNVQTQDYMITDHKVLTMQYNTKTKPYQPKFIKTRDRNF